MPMNRYRFVHGARMWCKNRDEDAGDEALAVQQRGHRPRGFENIVSSPAQSKPWCYSREKIYGRTKAGLRNLSYGQLIENVRS